MRPEIITLLLCATVYQIALSQDCNDDCVSPGPKELARQKLKDNTVKGLNKALVYISYLNYSDRTRDRAFTGPTEFERYRGKMIRKIQIKMIVPFGVSLEQPVAAQYTRFQKFANSVQFKTREWAVKNELLFKQGERVDPLMIADTEKNLWEGGNFKDLKIYIIPVEDDDEMVDVEVVLQDRWSWTISTGAQYNKAMVGIAFNNFLGLPQSVYQKISFNYRKDDPYTVYGGYEYDNIKRAHINVSSDYQYENLNKGGEFQVWRDFYSLTTRWAGHAFTGVYREQAAVPNALAQAIPTNIFYNYEDGWLARSFDIPEQEKSLSKIIVSARIYRIDYMSRPYMVSTDLTQMFINHTFALGGIGLANWNYYVDHSVFSMEKAEYFSKGFNIFLVGGYDNDEELGQRVYSGIMANYGLHIDNVLYLNTKVSYSGFLTWYGYNQLLGKWSNRFFSAPLDLGKRFFMRQFINTQFNLGFDRPSDREIDMNNDNGVHGVYVNYIRGNRTYVFNFETDVYPRFKVLGFSSSLFILADVAVVQQNSYKQGQLCEGYGGGIRLRNLSLGIGYFEFTFVYYPSFSLPGYKSYSIIATTDNLRGIPKDNLFTPGVLTPEF